MKLYNFPSEIIITTVLWVITPVHISTDYWSANALELSNVRCFKKHMQAEVLLAKNDLLMPPQYSSIYWKNIIRSSDPLKRCQPLFHSKGFMFKIPLHDLYKCGFTRVVNKLTNHINFHQNLMVETNKRNQSFSIKCVYKRRAETRKPNHLIVKRDVLPEDFQEDDDLEIVDTLQQSPAEPQVLMEVRQNGQLIDGMVTVIPGTPLIMEIKLNDPASSVYGINVNYLEVSDARDTSETIVFRGCTVDPYLFENFIMSSNKTLQAKFRAFKFPNTAFVQFRANIQICLRKCLISHCLNGQGRSRRDLSLARKHLYEVSVGLMMKIDGTSKRNSEDIRELENHVKQLTVKNVMLRQLH